MLQVKKQYRYIGLVRSNRSVEL